MIYKVLSVQKKLNLHPHTKSLMIVLILTVSLMQE